MKTQNRIFRNQPDYLFSIVRRPPGWVPASIDDAPAGAEVLSTELVASFDEAHDDLVRCNKLALRQDLDKWAVIQSAGGNL